MLARRPKYGFTLGATRELLLPATVLLCFVLYYSAEQPFGVVFACAVPMLSLYALAPVWASRSMTSFDRDCVALLSSGAKAGLVSRYRRALGMRLFGAPVFVAERRAMVWLEYGDARAARAAYREVIDELGEGAPPRVILGQAHASFLLGDDATAIALYRRVLGTVGALPGVERKLAYAQVRRGEDLRHALELLTRTEAELGDAQSREQHTLLRALAFAKLGDPERARSLLPEPNRYSTDLETLHDEIVRALEDHAGRVPGS